MTAVSDLPPAGGLVTRNSSWLRPGRVVAIGQVVLARRKPNVAAPGGVCALAAVGLMTGCFYTTPVNDRPSAEILRLETSDLRRGGHVDLFGQVVDDNGDAVTYRWQAFACGAGAASCDAAALAGGISPSFTVPVPMSRAGGEVLASLRVRLDVVDEHGAEAALPQVLVVDIGNTAPTIELQARALEPAVTHTVGLPSWFVVRVSDADDPLDRVEVTWDLMPPRDAEPGWLFEDPGDPVSDDPLTREEQRQLVVASPGTWTVRVVATDPMGAQAEATLAIAVDDDQPPCLAVLAPAPPPPGAALLLDGPRRLEVGVVLDDTAPYPEATDPYRRAPTFHWSIASDATGGELVDLDSDGNAVELDPASFEPGAVVDVRLEVDDGLGRVLPCGPDEPSCSIAGDTCVQRQTWRLEVP
jgi:hypothetical protein